MRGEKRAGISMYILFDSFIGATLHISIIDSLWIGVLAFAAALPFIGKKSLRDTIFYFFVFLYASFLFFLTIPIVLQPYPDNWITKMEWVSREILWNPFDSMRGIGSLRHFAGLIGGNFCLFMPIAVFLLLEKPSYRWEKFLALCLGISCGIEFLQFVGNVVIGYSFRTVETLDILLNACGALLCFFVLKAAQAKRRRRPAKPKTRR